MSKRTFLFITAFVFALAGGLHLVSAILKWELLINHWLVPTWASWIGGVALLLLAMRAWVLGILSGRQ